jgi:hypothetical protein
MVLGKATNKYYIFKLTLVSQQFSILFYFYWSNRSTYAIVLLIRGALSPGNTALSSTTLFGGNWYRAVRYKRLLRTARYIELLANWLLSQ